MPCSLSAGWTGFPEGDLTFTIEMALRKAQRLWPKKRVPGDHEKLRPVAEAVVAHLKLCGMRCFARAPRPGHGTPPDPYGVLRKTGGPGRGEG